MVEQKDRDTYVQTVIPSDEDAFKPAFIEGEFITGDYQGEQAPTEAPEVQPIQRSDQLRQVDDNDDEGR